MIKAKSLLRIGEPLTSSKGQKEEKEKATVTVTEIKSVFSSFSSLSMGRVRGGT